MSVVVIKDNSRYTVASNVSLKVAREIKAQVINLATEFVVVRILICTK